MSKTKRMTTSGGSKKVAFKSKTKPKMLGMPEPDHEQPVVLAPSDSRPQQGPSALWRTVSPEEIGEGFVALPDGEDSFRSTVKTVPQGFFELRDFRNRFITGKSSFIIYEVVPRLVKPKQSKPKRQIFNAHTKITKGEKVQFAKALEKNIQSVSRLFLQDLMPSTLAIHSAIEDVKEKLTQVVGESIGLPLDYYVVKSTQAVQLRIVRQICEDFSLTKDEAFLMTADFLPRLPKQDRKAEH